MQSGGGVVVGEIKPFLKRASRQTNRSGRGKKSQAKECFPDCPETEPPVLERPVSLPAVVVTIGGYLVTAGGVATAVSQFTNITDDVIGQKGEGGIDGNSP